MSNAVSLGAACCGCRRGRYAACFLTMNTTCSRLWGRPLALPMPEGVNSTCVCHSLRQKNICGGMHAVLLHVRKNKAASSKTNTPIWGDGLAHVEDVAHDVEGVVLQGQPGPKGGQQGFQREQQGTPCAGPGELVQCLRIVPRPVPAAIQAGSAHRNPQHEHSHLLAAAGTLEALADRGDCLIRVYVKPGWLMCLRAYPLR